MKFLDRNREKWIIYYSLENAPFQAACLLFLLGTNFVNNYVTMALPLTLVFVVLARKCMIPRFVDIRHVLLLDDPVPDFFKRNKDGDDKSGIALEVRMEIEVT